MWSFSYSTWQYTPASRYKNVYIVPSKSAKALCPNCLWPWDSILAWQKTFNWTFQLYEDYIIYLEDKNQEKFYLEPSTNWNWEHIKYRFKSGTHLIDYRYRRSNPRRALQKNQDNDYQPGRVGNAYYNFEKSGLILTAGETLCWVTWSIIIKSSQIRSST